MKISTEPPIETLAWSPFAKSLGRAADRLAQIEPRNEMESDAIDNARFQLGVAAGYIDGIEREREEKLKVIREKYKCGR